MQSNVKLTINQSSLYMQLWEVMMFYAIVLTWMQLHGDACELLVFLVLNLWFYFIVLYSMVAFLAFAVMPFMYFYYEEKDEDATTRQVWEVKQYFVCLLDQNSNGRCFYFVLFQRMCGALKYTIGFLIVGIVLLLVG